MGLLRPRNDEGAHANTGERHRVVVVGGGFGGLQTVRSLRHAPVEVTLIDRRNFHLFQPLLYQVATGALAPEEIAAPLRGVLKRQRNVRVVMGEVRAFDLDARRVIVDRRAEGEPDVAFAYDTLIVAGGSRYSYFGHDEWRPYAHEIKSLEAPPPTASASSGRSKPPSSNKIPVPRSLADLRHRRGRPNRSRDGRTDRRARARHIATRLPLG